ncbi:Hypothetical protein CAP_8817 [Chondromyces apiculatus DSM 436]|uniref:Uncharacterized protein n=1 Tax=Chondromyces apiculatus DSM 436 TaxID=1192034 RepID=A0A017SWS9_9BACT|nr:Hypothetical protein CAP_8817 [Chondromyces apiculatus DSM 436]
MFAEAAQAGVTAGGLEEDPQGVLEAHGRLTTAVARHTAERALREVVLTSAQALLG